MSGQMCWIATFSSQGKLVLHLRKTPYQPWSVYTKMSEYSVPDYRDVSNGSKGWATFQRLLKQGWTVIPTEQAYDNFAIDSLAS